MSMYQEQIRTLSKPRESWFGLFSRKLSCKFCGRDHQSCKYAESDREKRLAALDPNQKRLRTELYLENQKEYAYQTGEQPPQGDSGCTLDEASVALACKASDTALAVQAKREVGMLYEDITKAPYTIIFNRGTTARSLWWAVMVLRLVEAELKSEQQVRTGKEQLIAIHGNRFASPSSFSEASGRSFRTNGGRA